MEKFDELVKNSVSQRDNEMKVSLAISLMQDAPTSSSSVDILLSNLVHTARVILCRNSRIGIHVCAGVGTMPEVAMV
jgi:hypothetical protein